MPRTDSDRDKQARAFYNENVAYYDGDDIEYLSPEEQAMFYRGRSLQQADAIKNLSDTSIETDNARRERYAKELEYDTEALNKFKQDRGQLENDKQRAEELKDALYQTESARLITTLRARDQNINEEDIENALNIKQIVDNAFEGRINEINDERISMKNLDKRQENLDSREQSLDTREAQIAEKENESNERIRGSLSTLEEKESELEEREGSLQNERKRLEEKEREANEAASSALAERAKFQQASEGLMSKDPLSSPSRDLYDQTRKEDQARDNNLKDIELKYLAEKSVPKEASKWKENTAVLLGATAAIVGTILAVTGVGLIPGIAIAASGAAMAAGGFALKESADNDYESKRKHYVEKQYQNSKSIPQGRSGSSKAPSYDQQSLLIGNNNNRFASQTEVDKVDSIGNDLPQSKTATYGQSR